MAIRSLACCDDCVLYPLLKASYTTIRPTGLSVLLLHWGIDVMSFAIHSKAVYRVRNLEILKLPIVLRVVLVNTEIAPL